MIYGFDYFKRYEQPQLILCQPSDKEIGVINNPLDLKLEINFNDISSLSYKIYNNDEELTEVGESGGVSKDWIPSESKPNIYRLHKERRQVHALGIGYFIIDSVVEVEDSSGVYKNITCKSCESELNNIVAPSVALKEVNMYPLYNDTYPQNEDNYERFKYLEDITTVEVEDDDTGVYISESCILFNILCYAPTWRLSDECKHRFEEDEEYRELAATLRNFTDEDATVYSFLRDKIGEAYECVVLFDIENRTIDIKKYDDVFAQSRMILSNSNILDKCEVKTDINDYVNSLAVDAGAGQVWISDFTPDGTNVVYNFDHDIATGMIEGELAEALEYWKNDAPIINKITIESTVGLPQEVYPDDLTGYEGNDLYQFLRSSRKVINDWIEDYQTAKANNIPYSEIAPPNIAIFAASEEGRQGRYKIIVSTPFEEGDKLYFGWNRMDGALIGITPYDPSGTNTASEQANRIQSVLGRISDRVNPFQVSYVSGNDYFVVTQLHAGVGVPYLKIVNNRYNIGGTIKLEMLNAGHITGSATYTSFSSDTTHDGGAIEIVTKGYGWIQNYIEEDVIWDIADARKVLIYLNQEQQDAESCYIGANKLKESYNTMISALEKEREASRIAEVPDVDEGSVWNDQYEISTTYRDLWAKFAQAYQIISSQLKSWIGTINNKIAQANEGMKFQGAFKNYYIDKGFSTEEAEERAVALYNQLTRVIKQQSFKDDTIVITDEMKMYEKYDQERDLYNKSVNTLAKLIQPNADITIDAEPFIFNEEYKDITDSIEMGYCIYIELPNGEVPMYHLSRIDIDYGAPSCQLTFGDRIRSSDPADIFGELQKTASTAANIVASERIDWGVKTTAINYLMKEKDADITTTYRMMSNSVNNVRIDNTGLSCYSVNPTTGQEEYGFWGANGSLMFCEKDQNGNTVPKMAIGRIYHSDGSVEYGLYGDRILANTITAEKLAVGSVTTGSNYLRNGSFEGVDGTNVSYWNTPLYAVVSYNTRSVSQSETLNVGNMPAGRYILHVDNIYGGDNSNSDGTAQIVFRDASSNPLVYIYPQKGTQSSAVSNNIIVDLDSNWSRLQLFSNKNSSTSSGYTATYQNLKVYACESSAVNPPIGDSCLRLSQNSTASQTTDVLASGTYTLSYYYLLNSVGDSLSVSVSGLSSVTHTGTSENIGKWQKNTIEKVLSNSGTVTVGFSSTTGNVCVDGAMLAKGSGEFGSGEYSPHVSEQYAKYTAIDQNGVRIYDGNLTVYDGNGNKKIYTDVNNGTAKFYVKGNIYAEYLDATAGGNFAGWEFDSYSMFKKDASNHPKYGFSTYTGIQNAPETGYPAIWVGYTKDTNMPSNSDNSWAGKTSGGAKFMVLQDGTLYAKGAYIQGSITLGDSNQTVEDYVSSHSDLKTWQNTDNGLIAINPSTYTLLLNGNPSSSSDLVIKAGDNSSTYFWVDAAGNVKCNSLETGRIKVTGIGNNTTTTLGDSWTIGRYTLYTTPLGSGADANGWVLNASNNFRIDSNGNVYTLGYFITGDPGIFHSVTGGIEISNYDMYFRIDSSGSQKKYCGSISPIGTTGIALSGIDSIYFGDKNNGYDNWGNQNTWHERAAFLFENNATSFVAFKQSLSSRSLNLGSSSYYWDNLYVKNITMGSGGTTAGLSIDTSNRILDISLPSGYSIGDKNHVVAQTFVKSIVFCQNGRYLYVTVDNNGSLYTQEVNL